MTLEVTGRASCWQRILHNLEAIAAIAGFGLADCVIDNFGFTDTLLYRNNVLRVLAVTNVQILNIYTGIRSNRNDYIVTCHVRQLIAKDCCFHRISLFQCVNFQNQGDDAVASL